VQLSVQSYKILVGSSYMNRRRPFNLCSYDVLLSLAIVLQYMVAILGIAIVQQQHHLINIPILCHKQTLCERFATGLQRR
jgi:hypothetical protein